VTGRFNDGLWLTVMLAMGWGCLDLFGLDGMGTFSHDSAKFQVYNGHVKYHIRHENFQACPTCLLGLDCASSHVPWVLLCRGIWREGHVVNDSSEASMATRDGVVYQ
jgi:hypothetical protein